MKFMQWIDKYIPEGMELVYLKKAGLTKNMITIWRRGKSKPTCLPIIYLSMVISKEQNIDYKTVVVEGIKSAGAING